MYTKLSIGKWLGIFLLVMLADRAQAQTKEYQVKAVFLFNFAHFVDWPPDAFTNAAAPLRIGILGDDPFGGYLDEIVRGEKVGGHPLAVQHYRRVEDVRDCQVLFISQSEAARGPKILQALQGRSILTVGEVDGFCQAGGVMRFVMRQNKIHLRINPEAAKNARLTVSSKLLRLAELVPSGGD